MGEIEFWLRLLKVKNLGNKKRNELALRNLQYQNVDEILQQLPLTDVQRTEFYKPSRYLDSALEWVSKADCHILRFGEAAYPYLLQQIAFPPTLLFVQGDVRTLHNPQIAIVGSRMCSRYGEFWGRHFAQSLSKSGLTITSGLALGIDGVAHLSTLEVTGYTVAVLGSGLSQIYPRRHFYLVQRIIEQGGALVSEFLPTEAPLAAHFPRRNRIISGLSHAVLVVEASMYSGSLITARYALEQGRDVFALPGCLDSQKQSGCHWLIQQGAYLTTQPADILEQLQTSLHWLAPITTDTQDTDASDENLPESPFANLLIHLDDQVMPVDLLAGKVGLPVADLVVQLLDLEMAGYVAAVPGGYIKVRRAKERKMVNTDDA